MRSFIAGLMLVASAAVFADIVAGNGQVQTENRPVAAFSRVAVGGSGILRVHRGPRKVEVTSDSNILGLISTEVAGGELEIGFKPFTSVTSYTTLEYDVTMPDLSALRLSGSGDAYVDTFSGDDISMAVSGSGGVKADLAYSRVELETAGSGGFDAKVLAKSLALRCSGSGDAFIAGRADSADLVVSGSGFVGARSFEVADARVIISGSGNIEIKAVSSLDATVSGSGEVKYWGRPSLTQRVRGSGEIVAAH
jgi:hypothetical protein